jgi:hypothetical protein
LAIGKPSRFPIASIISRDQLILASGRRARAQTATMIEIVGTAKIQDDPRRVGFEYLFGK